LTTLCSKIIIQQLTSFLKKLDSKEEGRIVSFYLWVKLYKRIFMITNAVQKGKFIHLYNEKGIRMGSPISAGNGDGDGLKGFTSTSVTVQKGEFIITYDEKGRTIGSPIHTGRQKDSSSSKKRIKNQSSENTSRSTGGFSLKKVIVITIALLIIFYFYK